jgi:TetR/AcrR family transcriptional regulator, transcriptional repressor of aconitase
MPKVAKEHGEARRRQIVDAAYRCFARRGFHQTTMRDIYQEAGLSPGAVYHYFDGKDEIIQASFDLDLRRSHDLLAAAKESSDPLGALTDLVEFFYHGLAEAAALGAGSVNVQGWGEALVNPPLLGTIREVMDTFRDALAEVIRRAQKAGQLDPSVDPTAMSQLLLSLYYGLELQKAMYPDLDVESYAAAARALLRPADRRAGDST